MKKSKLFSRVCKSTLAFLVFGSSFIFAQKPFEVKAVDTETKAEVSDKRAIMFAETGINNISNPTYTEDLNDAWQGDYMHWGTKDGNPLKWQILNTHTSVNSSESILMLSEELGTVPFDDVGTADSYGTSSIYNSMQGFLDKYASYAQWGLKRALNNGGSYETEDGLIYNETDFLVLNSNWIAPTGKMLSNNEYGFSSDLTKEDKARLTNMTSDYWLSSTNLTNSVMNAGTINSDGKFGGKPASENKGVRAATHITSSYIKFISVADSDATLGNPANPDVLMPVSTQTNGKWKVTLEAASVGEITHHTEKRIAKDKLEVTLNKKGHTNNPSVSVIATDLDGKNITHYGRIGTVTGGEQNDQKFTITLPENVINGTAKLQMFLEDYKGENDVNIAGPSVDISTVYKGEYKYKNKTGTDETKVVDFNGVEKYVPFDEAGTYYTDMDGNKYGLDKWVYDDNSFLDNNGVVQKNFIATAQYKLFEPEELMLFNYGARGYLNPQPYTVNQEWDNHKLNWAGYKWRILNTNESEYNLAKISSDGNAVLLQSEDSIGSASYNNASDTQKGTAYINSELNKFVRVQAEMNYESRPQEKAATMMSKRYREFTFEGKRLREFFGEEDKDRTWFSPTLTMMINSEYGYPNDSSENLSRAYGDPMWLVGSSDSAEVGIAQLGGNGSVTTTKNGISDKLKVYPSTQLLPTSILMVSAGPKKSNGVGKDALKKVETSGAKEWKTTIKDKDQKLNVISTTTDTNELATIKYTNTGGETLSAIILNEDETKIISYGQIAALSGTGEKTAKIQLPADFYTNKYKLKLFTEIHHDDATSTDYASEFVTADMKSNNVGDITIKYLDVYGNAHEKVYKDVVEGTKLSDDADFKNLVKIIPNGYRQSDTLWSFTNDATVSDFDFVTKSFVANVNYTKLWDVTFQYRKADHSEVINESITVDEGTDLETANKLPTLPTEYERINGVSYRFNETGNHWKVKSGAGTISDVSDNLTVEAPTTKMFETIIKYRNEEKPSEYISNEYYIDENGSVLGNDSSNNPYLPVLKKQIKGYRLKENNTDDKTSIWKSNSLTSTLTTIKEPSTIQPEYVKNWEVLFKTWDDKAWPIAPWKDSPIYVDDKTGLGVAEIPVAPDRLFHAFSKWNQGLTNITSDITVKPEYEYKTIEIKNDKDKDALSSNDAKALFTGDKDTINAQLKSIYNPELFSGGVKYKDQNGISVKLKDDNDYAKLKEGTKKSYSVIIDYLNPQDNDYILQREVPLMINSKVTEEPINHGKIAANDFSLSIDEVSDTTKFASYAGAYAFDKSQSSQAISIEDASAIKGKTGIYPVTFKATLDGEEVHVSVNVTVKSKSASAKVLGSTERISANNIAIQVSDVAGIKADANQLIALGNANAYIAETGEIIFVASVSGIDKLEAKRSKCDITFKTTNNTSVTISVVVSDKSSEGTEFKVNVNDVFISKDEVLTISEDELITLANAKAVHKNTGEYGTLTVDKASLKKERGIYEIVFKASDNTEVKANVQVVDKSETGSDDRISANNFSISMSEIDTISNDSLISLANAKAVHKNTGVYETITVDKTDLQAKLGKYEIIFTSANGSEVSVQVSVMDNVASANGESIYANNFVIKKSDVETLTKEKLVKLSNAHATNLISGAEEKITNVDFSDVQATAGKYKVIFTTDKNTSVYSIVSIQKHSEINDADNEEIHSDDFILSVDQMETLLSGPDCDDKLLAYAHVKGFVKDTTTPIDVNVVSYTLEAKQGVYEVVYETGTTNTQITSIVNVTSKGVQNAANNELISANDIVLQISDVNALNEEKIIELAKASAMSLDAGVFKEVRVTTSVQAKQGIYNAIFKTARNTSLKVQIAVKDKGVTNPDKNIPEAIYANNITINYSDVQSMNSDKIIELSQAKGINTITGNDLDVNAAGSISKLGGDYPIEIFTENGTTLYINVTVIPEPIPVQQPAVNKVIGNVGSNRVNATTNKKENDVDAKTDKDKTSLQKTKKNKVESKNDTENKETNNIMDIVKIAILPILAILLVAGYVFVTIRKKRNN